MRNYYLYEEDNFIFTPKNNTNDLKPYNILSFYGVNYPLDFIPEHIKKVVIFENSFIPLSTIPNFIKNIVVYGNKKLGDLKHLELETLIIFDNLLNLSLKNYLIKSLFLDNVKISEFPKNLENLNIKSCKNLNLQNLFNIKELFLKHTNIPLDFLPTTLKNLEIEGSYQYSLNNLPVGLERLKLRIWEEYTLNELPFTLKTLILNYKVNLMMIPLNLTYLDINNDLTMDIENTKIEVLITNCNYLKNLPLGLKKLVIEGNTNELVLPKNLEELIILEKSSFNKKLILNENLKKLKIGGNFNSEIIFNENLLDFSFFVFSKFNQPMVLPQSLKILEIVGNFRYDYELILPKKLKKFYLGSNSFIKSLTTYSHELDFGKKNITILKMVFLS